jgi:hypothetical protein
LCRTKTARDAATIFSTSHPANQPPNNCHRLPHSETDPIVVVAPQILLFVGLLPSDRIVPTAPVSYGCLANESLERAVWRLVETEPVFEESVRWHLSKWLMWR